jgi:hypothetical protein
MALPRLTRLLERTARWWLAAALALAAATAVTAGGAVIAIHDDEPVPGSRLPMSANKAARARRATGSNVPAPRTPCPGTTAPTPRS